MLSFFKYLFFALALSSTLYCENIFENGMTVADNETISEYFMCLYDEIEFSHFKKQFAAVQTTINVQETEVKNLKMNLQNHTENLKSTFSELKSMNHQLTELIENHSENLKKIVVNDFVELNINRIEDLTNNISELRIMKNQLTELMKNHSEELKKNLKDEFSELNESHTTDLQSVLLELKSMKDQLAELHKKIPKENHPTNCNEAIGSGRKNGIYDMYSETNEISYTAYCSKSSDGGKAWTVIQRRQDGSEDFNRNWSDYKIGFGDLSGEYWLGLERIHLLTTGTRHELLVKIQDFDGNWAVARYDNFVVGKESDDYPLQQLGKFSGTAVDALEFHLSMKFSTKDKDNGESSLNCAEMFKAGWWYINCYWCNLNGKYLTNQPKNFQGIQWRKFKENYSLKYAAMLIRPYSS